MVGLLGGFVEDNPISFLQGGWVVAKTEEGGEERHKYAWRDNINPFPNRIGDAIGSGGRGG